MLLKRSYEKEIMDDFSIDDERINLALSELKVINKYLGGNRTSSQGLRKFLKDENCSKLTLLDVGSGNSKILSGFISERVSTFSVDINKQCCVNARDSNPNLKVICADVFSLPFNGIKFDVVHLSLFLHHFKEEQITIILKGAIQQAGKGIVINDLQRSIFAYWGIKLLTLLFSKSEMVRNDGPLSVRKGFRKKELITILKSIGVKDFSIKWKLAFRWLVVINVEDNHNAKL